ncbi:MAG: hypothetical protein U1F87_09325 [Kiritimatiellia bacterium]
MSWRAECFDLQTCPFAPRAAEEILLELDIPDEHIPAGAHQFILDAHGEHYHLSREILSRARLRRLTDDEIMAAATADLDRYLLPSPLRVGDSIAGCPKARREERFGPWLTRAYEEHQRGLRLRRESAGKPPA